MGFPKGADMKILLMNGPNLNMLGVREPEVYGHETLADIEAEVAAYGNAHGVRVDCFQSNCEGTLIDKLHEAHLAYDGVVYNPGAHTHYSYALRDAVAAISTPVVEVHLSNINAREPFRAMSVMAPVCIAQIAGKGKDGYKEAIDVLVSWRQEQGEGVVRMGGAACGEDLACGEGAACGEGSAHAWYASSAFRTNRLRSWCAENGADAFLVRDTSNIRWLTAFDDVFDEERAHALLVTPERAVLHTDSRYLDACERAAAGTGIEVDAERMTHAAFVAAQTGRGANGGATENFSLAIENSIALAEYRRLQKALDASLVETADVVVGLRAVKDAGEIARLRAAQAVTDAAFSHIISFMRPGMTEREVQIELEDFIVRHGAEGLAFPSIVAAGANVASPHAVPGSTVLEAGQCVVLDFGARAHGYCSDMTRTVFLGEPSARMREAYEVLRRANEKVEAAIRPGATGKQMHELAERILEEGGFGGRMGHSLGHGVGIDIHELPNLSVRNPSPLAPGNVVTVEPGIYLPGEFGMRLEDFGVVTETGYDVFTQSSHDMVVL